MSNDFDARIADIIAALSVTRTNVSYLTTDVESNHDMYDIGANSIFDTTGELLEADVDLCRALDHLRMARESQRSGK